MAIRVWRVVIIASMVLVFLFGAIWEKESLLEGLVIGTLIFAVITPALCIKMFVPIVSEPTKKDLMAMRIVSIAMLVWLSYGFVIKRLHNGERIFGLR